MTPREEIKTRNNLLQQELRKKELDGALIIHPIDIYYYAGTRQNAVLWIPVEGEPLLLVRKSLTRAKEEAGVSDIRPFPSGKDFPGLFPDSVRKIGMTFDVVPMQQHAYYAKLLSNREFVDISPINREIRSVKSAWELERLADGGTKLADIFRQVPTFLTKGMREVDLAAEFEYRLRKAGSEGYVRMRAFNQELFQGLAVSESAGTPGFFDGAVTGKGMSPASPHGASAAAITGSAPVLVDYTGIFDGYILDMTRIFSFGPLDSELRRAFELSLEIQDFIVKGMIPGTICEDLFAGALRMAEEAGLAQNFMGAPGENARFVGHGVGLELDEFPVLAQGFKVPLKVGQTIAVEPKFVFPGRGVVGIENTFAVTPEGGRKLTDLPDEVIIL